MKFRHALVLVDDAKKSNHSKLIVFTMVNIYNASRIVNTKVVAYSMFCCIEEYVRLLKYFSTPSLLCPFH